MSESPPPLLRVVRGDPSPEELGALVAVITARPAAPGPTPTAPEVSSGWAARRDGVRRPVLPGPGAWRASASPRR